MHCKIPHRMNTDTTSCAHKWGQYTLVLITTHLIQKYPIKISILQQRAENKARNTKMYRGQETHPIRINTVVLIKFLPYSGATAQTHSAALWGVSGSYAQAPAQQGMSGLVWETSHLWLYSSPSPSLQPILREPATSILIVPYTFECIMWVATESLWRYVQGNKWILKLHFHNFFAMWLKWCTETTY